MSRTCLYFFSFEDLDFPSLVFSNHVKIFSQSHYEINIRLFNNIRHLHMFAKHVKIVHVTFISSNMFPTKDRMTECLARLVLGSLNVTISK